MWITLTTQLTHTHTYTRNTYMRQQKSLVFAPMSLTTDIFFLHSTFRIFSYGNFSQWGNSDIRSRDQRDSCQVCSSVFVDRRRSQFNGTLTKWVISLHYITWAIDTSEAAKCMRMHRNVRFSDSYIEWWWFYLVELNWLPAINANARRRAHTHECKYNCTIWIWT